MDSGSFPLQAVVVFLMLETALLILALLPGIPACVRVQVRNVNLVPVSGNATPTHGSPRPGSFMDDFSPDQYDTILTTVALTWRDVPNATFIGESLIKSGANKL